MMYRIASECVVEVARVRRVLACVFIRVQGRLAGLRSVFAAQGAFLRSSVRSRMAALRSLKGLDGVWSWCGNGVLFDRVAIGLGCWIGSRVFFGAGRMTGADDLGGGAVLGGILGTWDGIFSAVGWCRGGVSVGFLR